MADLQIIVVCDSCELP